MVRSEPRNAIDPTVLWGRLRVFLCLAGLTACAEPETTRYLAADSWDTIFVLGTEQESDTTLIRPSDFLLTDEQLFVLEDLEQQVRAFDRGTGRRRWAFGRKGEGPGEMGFAMKMFFDPSGDLRIWDSRNRKLIRVGQDGVFKGESRFPDPWGLSDSPQGFGETLIWFQLSPERPAFLSSMDGGDPVDSVRIEWPVSDDLPYLPTLVTASAGSEDRWVQGLMFGPYFAVGDETGVEVHSMVEPVPYGYAAREQLSRRNRPADSARWGARDVAMTENEIFILTGGRPPKAAHPPEPSQFIDVYDGEGKYLRSYLLPFDVGGIATDDGQSFFVLPGWDDPFPRIFGLVPVGGR